jgi:hypothetical protein
VARSFACFHAAAHEASRGRVYGGTHFDFDRAVGLDIGRDIGTYVVDHLLGLC